MGATLKILRTSPSKHRIACSVELDRETHQIGEADPCLNFTHFRVFTGPHQLSTLYLEGNNTMYQESSQAGGNGKGSSALLRQKTRGCWDFLAWPGPDWTAISGPTRRSIRPPYKQFFLWGFEPHGEAIPEKSGPPIGKACYVGSRAEAS